MTNICANNESSLEFNLRYLFYLVIFFLAITGFYFRYIGKTYLGNVLLFSVSIVLILSIFFKI